jgi:hypothetical protein
MAMANGQPHDKSRSRSKDEYLITHPATHDIELRHGECLWRIYKGDPLDELMNVIEDGLLKRAQRKGHEEY